jgi:hypothetical protein
MTGRDTFEEVLERDLSRSPSPHVLADLDQRLNRRVASSEQASRLRLRRSLVLSIAALVVLVPGLALAGRLTNEPLTEAPLGLISADEFRAEIRAAMLLVPKPRTTPWPAYLDIAYGPGMYSRGGGRVQVEAAAFCLWTADWVSSRGRGDETRTATATRALEASRTWDLYRGPLATASQRSVVEAVLDGIARGDEAPARSHLTSNCATGA